VENEILLLGFFGLLGFSEVEILEVGCIVINSASSWFVQSNQKLYSLKNQQKRS